MVVSFPEGAFADVPEWSPGEGFAVTVEDVAWRRDNGDGTVTAVVAGVGPAGPPALEGGRWAEPEVWTVTAPAASPYVGGVTMWDKPHKVMGLLGAPGAVVRREPYAGHPVEDVHRYWEAFERRWGFVPRRMRQGLVPFGDRRRWVALETEPGHPYLPSERDLLECTVRLAREYGARARVYGWDVSRRRFGGVLGETYGAGVPSHWPVVADRLGVPADTRRRAVARAIQPAAPRSAHDQRRGA